MPWEATTSYGGGTSDGPRAILEASAQVDLYDLDVEKPYEAGIHMLAEPEAIIVANGEGKALAAKIIEAGGAGDDPELPKRARAGQRALRAGQRVGRARDDAPPRRAERSSASSAAITRCPFGALHGARREAAELRHPPLRRALRHAPRVRGLRALARVDHVQRARATIPQVTKLVQVGIRDVCEEEIDYCAQPGRARAHVLRPRARQAAPCGRAVRDDREGHRPGSCPDEVWVSFDIDGLDPRFCPHTGTPVPGGLEPADVVAILREVAALGQAHRRLRPERGRPEPADEHDEWDANVGARMLYKLIGFTLASQGKAKLLD